MYYLYDNHECKSRCPDNDGYYEIYSSFTVWFCKSCPENCQKCTEDECKACYSNFYLYSNNSCYADCFTTEGYYVKSLKNGGKACLACSAPNCGVCPKDTCESCLTGCYLYENNLCEDHCNTTQGYYSEALSGSVLKCNKCTSANCTTCPQNTCTECNNSQVDLYLN